MIHTRKDSKQQQTAAKNAADRGRDDTAADRVNHGRVELNAGWPSVDGPLVGHIWPLVNASHGRKS